MDYVTVIGKCPIKGCKSANRGQFAVLDGPAWTDPGWRPWKFADGCHLNRGTFRGLGDTPASAMAHWIVHQKLTEAGGWICQDHDRFLVQKPVTATSTGTRCTSVCWNSTSIACACSCGGANHGRHIAPKPTT